MAWRAVNSWISGAREDAMVGVDAAVQDHLRENRDVAGGGKKSSVAGDAAHGPGVFVVHFALQQALAEIDVVFGGSNRGPQLARRIELRIVHAERRENVLLGEFVERDSGEALNDFAEQDETEVGIFHLRAGLVNERLGQHARENGVVTFGLLVKIAMRGKAGIVEKQIANGDARAPGGIGIGFRGGGPFGQIARYGRVEIEAFLLHEHHRRRWW